MSTQHPTGFTCHVCGGIAVVELDSGYLCAEHAIKAMTSIEIDLRDEPPAVSNVASMQDYRR